MQKVNCKKYAQELLTAAKTLATTGSDRRPGLAIITVGEDPASKVYVRGKMNDALSCGFIPENFKLKNDETAYYNLTKIIQAVNIPESPYDGVILQLPMPGMMHEFEDDFLININEFKDVDGLNPNSDFKPCTPQGIIYVLEQETEELVGKNVLVIGRSKLVGKPLAEELLKMGCTVTIAHSKTRNLESLLSNYDIIISAAGQRNLVDLKKCTNAEIVIDVGINRKEDGKICGDCFNFEDTESGLKVTTVPGGIGLMTRAVLMVHTAEAYVRNNRIKKGESL